MPFCQNCGYQIKEGDRFCFSCGHDVLGTSGVPSGPHIVRVERAVQPQYPQQYVQAPLPVTVKEASGSRKAFWLGLIGGIIGILAGLFAGFVASVGEAFVGDSYGLYTNAISAIGFSIMGMVGGFLETWKKAGGIMLILAAIGIFVSVSMFGLLSAILFFVGGALMLSDVRKENLLKLTMMQSSPQPIIYKTAIAVDAEQPNALNNETLTDGAIRDDESSTNRALTDRERQNRQNNIIGFIAIVIILLSAGVAAWLLYGPK